LDVEVLRNNQKVLLHLDPPSGEQQMDPAVLGFKFSLSRAVVNAVDENSPRTRRG